MGPYAGGDYNLTESHSRLWSAAFHPNDEEFQEIFPQLFKNGTTNRKRESTRWGEGRSGSWLYVLERHLLEHGKPRVDFNPASQLALTLVRGLTIWAQFMNIQYLASHTNRMLLSLEDLTLRLRMRVLEDAARMRRK